VSIQSIHNLSTDDGAIVLLEAAVQQYTNLFSKK